MQGLLLADTPATQTPPTEWAVIVIGLLTLVYAAFVRPLKKKKQKRDPLEQTPGKSMLAQQRAVERDMTALLVEYEQMMRTMTTQLETRVAKLEILLQEADRTIATLRTERDAARNGAATPATVPTPVPTAAVPDTKPETMPEPETPAAIQRSTAVPPNAAVMAELRTEAVQNAPAIPDAPGSQPAAIDGSSSHETIYAMADQGLDISQIARRLGQQYGEVELILALRPQLANGELRSSKRMETFAAPMLQGKEPAAMEATSAVATLPGSPSRPHHHGKHKKRC